MSLIQKLDNIKNGITHAVFLLEKFLLNIFINTMLKDNVFTDRAKIILKKFLKLNNIFIF